MHRSSTQHFEDLIRRHLAQYGPAKVLDVGAMSLNGAYRPLFDPQRWAYTGLDLGPGPNVDVVVEDPYDWPLADESYDLVVSGQVFEHVEFFWLSILEIRRVLKPGGLAFLAVPSRGPQHRHPVDCWRFYPDGHAALAKWSGLELVEVNNPWQIDNAIDFDSMWEWGDCIGVFRKPACPSPEFGQGLKVAVKAHLLDIARSASAGHYPSVRIPKSRNYYLSFWSSLKFRFRKHFIR